MPLRSGTGGTLAKVLPTAICRRWPTFTVVCTPIRPFPRLCTAVQDWRVSPTQIAGLKAEGPPSSTVGPSVVANTAHQQCPLASLPCHPTRLPPPSWQVNPDGSDACGQRREPEAGPRSLAKEATPVTLPPAEEPRLDAAQQAAPEQPQQAGSAEGSGADEESGEGWQEDELEPWKTDPYW